MLGRESRRSGGGHLPLNPLYILNATDRPVSRLGGAFLPPPPLSFPFRSALKIHLSDKRSAEVGGRGRSRSRHRNVFHPISGQRS